MDNNQQSKIEIRIEEISNYEVMYWIIFSDGLHRLRCGAWVMGGIVLSYLLQILGSSPAVYLSCPILYYIIVLYKRSTKTGYIFGFRSSAPSGFARIKLLIFVNSILCLGYPNAEIAHLVIMCLIGIYGAGLVYTGKLAVKIQLNEFDSIFRSKFGSMTSKDIEARKKLFHLE